MDALDTVDNTNIWHQEPGDILASYLVGEEIWVKEIEKMKFGEQEISESGGQEITSKVEEDESQLSKMCRIL